MLKNCKFILNNRVQFYLDFNWKTVMRKFRLFVAMFLAVFFITSCEEEVNIKAIVLDSTVSEEDLAQIIEAGETSGTSISFKTAGAWTSEIKVLQTRETSVEWISISPDHGDKAGDYTVNIILEKNDTDEDRAAEIIISSGGESVSVSVTQQAVPFIPVTSVTLSSSSLAMTEGDVVQLTATVKPDDATDKSVVWSSDAPEVAEVDQEGNVTAKSAGKAVITATSGDVSATCSVDVSKLVIPVSTITLSSSSLAMTEGDAVQLTATVKPDDATDKTVVWSSDAPEVAEVDQEGNVTAKSVGKAIITAKSGDVSATCSVDVSKLVISVSTITLSPASLTMIEGENASITVKITPENATDKTVVWSSDAPEVAEVDQDGNVTALTVGSAVVTATCGELSASCKVTVDPRVIPLTSLSITKDYIELMVGDEKPLSIRYAPANATDKNFVWSSDAPHIVEVDETTGRIKAISAGTAIITVRCSGLSSSCTVVVSEPVIPVTKVIVEPSELEISKGGKASLAVTLQPADATDKTVVWSSDAPEIAEVDQNGTVMAISEGSAVITAKSGEVSGTCVVTVAAVAAGDNYIDEYGIDHGPGIKISTFSDGDIVWAPVNCGYHATDYKYGKLYQWGRKYGQGYDGSDATSPVIAAGGVTLEEGQDPDNANTYFKGAGNDWLGESDDKLWNSGTEEAPVKTENDPCPDGWRVPTYNELASLQSRKSSSWTANDEGQYGYWFSDSNDPSQTFFLPAAGLISGASWEAGEPDDRGSKGYYWSSQPYNNGAAKMQSMSKYSVMGSSNYRCYGYSVRCVKE